MHRNERIALTVLCALFALSMARICEWEPLTDTDAYLYSRISFREGPSFITFAKYSTHAGSAFVCLPLICAVALTLRGRYADCGLVMVGAMISVVLVINVMKVGYGLPRPPDPLISARGYGFPSGHAAQSLACYGLITFLARRVRWHHTVITALSIVAVAIVCWSRIFLGVHYFSDVVGGILVGLAAVALSTRSPRCTGY